MSLEQWSLCVISREGKIVAEGKALSEPETLARWVRKSGLEIERVGLEAGPLSQWLTAGLEAAGFEVALLENRFSSSRPLGPYLGLTPRRYQSGETDIAGRISCAGDAMARSALYEAATVILTRAIPLSPLKRWALDLAGRRGVKRARVALARKLSVILHRMWVDGALFTGSQEDRGVQVYLLTEQLFARRQYRPDLLC